MKKNIKIIFINLFICLCWQCLVNAQTQWIKHIANPVLTPGPAYYDFVALGQPTVLFENDTLKMWYAGAGADYRGRICYAVSVDGINWIKRDSAVLDVGKKGDWDAGWLDTPEVLKDSNGYVMFYYGDTIQQFSAISSAIGIAYSPDGIHWTKDTNNPVFTKGIPGTWDDTWIESPAGWFNDTANEYWMYYNGVDTTTWKIQIGLAVSDDGVNWARHPLNPLIETSPYGMHDDIWLGTPCLIYDSGLFELWYSSTSTRSYDTTIKGFDTIYLCYAYSSDGINWTKYAGNPLFVTQTAPYDSATDTGGPWAPDVVFNSAANEYQMWYETAAGICFASAPVTVGNRRLKSATGCGIKIFPNPALSAITILFPDRVEDATIQLFNNCGLLISTWYPVCGDTWNTDISRLRAGIYLFKVISRNKIWTGRMVRL